MIKSQGAFRPCESRQKQKDDYLKHDFSVHFGVTIGVRLVKGDIGKFPFEIESAVLLSQLLGFSQTPVGIF